MSAIIIDGSLVHYEVFGRGQPVIFLHSWLGSWRYWVPAMEMISDRYRAYAFDFWGFGDSDRSRDHYDISVYVEQLLLFMRELGMVKANLIGHGLGGMVAVQAAKKSPNTFLKLVVSGMPVQGEALSAVIKPTGLSRFLGRSNPSDIWLKLLKQVEVGGDIMISELIEDTANTAADVQQEVLDSIIETDLSEDLETLATPTLAVYGGRDVIVAPEHANAFEASATEHQVLLLPKMNHFPFLEATNTFNRLLLDFLTSQGTTVQIKEEWRRRTKQTDYI